MPRPVRPRDPNTNTKRVVVCLYLKNDNIKTKQNKNRQQIRDSEMNKKVEKAHFYYTKSGLFSENLF